MKSESNDDEPTDSKHASFSMTVICNHRIVIKMRLNAKSELRMRTAKRLVFKQREPRVQPTGDYIIHEERVTAPWWSANFIHASNIMTFSKCVKRKANVKRGTV
jgi:hypothetical protein